MFPRLPSPPLPAVRATARCALRPRGLWKSRGTQKHGLALDSGGDPRPTKRQRYQCSDDTSDCASSDASDDNGGYYILEYPPEPACDMDPSEPAEAETKVEDWENLKELFARTAKQYECDDAKEALPLLRGVIHDCHRSLLLYEDPSVLFAEPSRPRCKSPEPISISPSTKPRKKCKCKESPTAFHAILGTALFLFGNLIAQDASLALPDEPSSPATYWLAALDVFETGENLPSRTAFCLCGNRPTLSFGFDTLTTESGHKSGHPLLLSAHFT
ncbi:hypothetical protein B0H14DRAFT_118870 [Mycena olivaceomarginata]|nr:hypothetical protein B0H14DRAFT_118870 [Mycena olivaceomarginata]